MREKLGRLGDHGGVHIDDLAFAKLDQPRRFIQENAAPGALPARVGVGEEMADIRLAQRAEDRIANRVHQHVGIRMPVQTLRVRNLHAAQDQFSPLDQGMHIIADANMNHAANYSAAPWRTTKEFHRGLRLSNSAVDCPRMDRAKHAS